MKLLNKSIEGTADDEDEGVTPDTAIRAGLELLKVSEHACCERACPLVSSIFRALGSTRALVVIIYTRMLVIVLSLALRFCLSPTPRRSTLPRRTSLFCSVSKWRTIRWQRRPFKSSETPARRSRASCRRSDRTETFVDTT